MSLQTSRKAVRKVYQKVKPIECTRVIPDLIKNNEIKNAYLLYGEEAYLVRQNEHKLVSFLMPDMDSMNYNLYEGNKIDIEAVTDLADTMPFFKDYRVIVIENSGLFSKGGERLAEYIKKMPDTVKFIFVEDNVDARTALFKAVKEAGVVVEYVRQEEETLMTWIKGRIVKEGKSVQNSVVNFFVKRVGDDMLLLSNELEKLITYCLDKPEITVDDVKAVTNVTLEDRVFDMIEAVSKKDRKTTMMLYHDLLELKEPPVKILALLQAEFKRMVIIKEQLDHGRYGNQIADATGIKEFVVKKRMPIVSKYDRKELIDIFGRLIEADEAYKSGNISDTMAVETVLFEITEPKKR